MSFTSRFTDFVRQRVYNAGSVGVFLTGAQIRVNLYRCIYGRRRSCIQGTQTGIGIAARQNAPHVTPWTVHTRPGTLTPTRMRSSYLSLLLPLPAPPLPPPIRPPLSPNGACLCLYRPLSACLSLDRRDAPTHPQRALHRRGTGLFGTPDSEKKDGQGVCSPRLHQGARLRNSRHQEAIVL